MSGHDPEQNSHDHTQPPASDQNPSDPSQIPEIFSPWITNANVPWTMPADENPQPNNVYRVPTDRTVPDPVSYTDEDGRQYSAYKSGKYLLPNDGEEQVSSETPGA
jgi:hypothetical protein